MLQTHDKVLHNIYSGSTSKTLNSNLINKELQQKKKHFLKYLYLPSVNNQSVIYPLNAVILLPYFCIVSTVFRQELIYH